MSVIKADYALELGRVRQLLLEIGEAATTEEKVEMIEALRAALENHSHLEESRMPPALFLAPAPVRKVADQLLATLEEARYDHQELKDLLKEVDDAVNESEVEENLASLTDCFERHLKVCERTLVPMLDKLQVA